MKLDDLSKSTIKEQLMDKYNTNTTFNKWFSPINLTTLSEGAQKEMAQFNRYVTKMDFEKFLKLLLHAIHDEKESLRHLENTVMNPKLQQEIGLESISYSQLARSLKRCPQSVLMELFFQLLGQIEQHPKHPHKKLYILDSTTFSLSQSSYEWAKFRPTKSGIKVHLTLRYMDKGDVYPVKFEQSTASVHDKNYLFHIVEEPNATYVFDRGYLDYLMLDQLDDQGYFFVTRLKSNSLTCDTEKSTWKLTDDSPIISDQLTRLGGKSEITNRYRVVTIHRQHQSNLRLVTNRHDLSAEEISAIYQSRWEIELFFKHIKQHLTIKHYFSQSEEGVTNQVILAMIAYLLTYLVRLRLGTHHSLFQVLRTLRTLLFEPFEQLILKLVPT